MTDISTANVDSDADNPTAARVQIKDAIDRANQAARAVKSVEFYGAKGDGSTDDLAAVLAAKAEHNRVHFPRKGTGTTVYYIGTFSAGALDGAIMSAEAGVVVSFAANFPYTLFKAVVFATDVRAYFRDISSYATFTATPTAARKDTSFLRPPARRKRTALNATSSYQVAPRELAAWPGSDVFNAASATTTTQTVSFASSGVTFRGAFVGLGAYETVSALFDSGTTPGAVGVIIRGTLGFSIVYSNGSGNYYVATKLTGAAVSGNSASLSWTPLGQGSYQSYAPDKSVWSVSKVAGNLAIIKLNGKALTLPYAPVVGDIFEVGFVCYTSSAFSISGLTIERRTDAVIGGQYLDELMIYGDSTAERFPGSWDQSMRQLLDGRYGIRLNTVINYAVAGESLDQQYTRMQANGYGNSYYVVVCAGTNNIQGLQSIASFKTTLTNVLNHISAAGRRAIVVAPWMWYTTTESGGTGQGSTNYAAGAPYRMWMERLAYEFGVPLVKLCDELPNPDPGYLSTQPLTALLRDNIHQDALAHQLYAEAIAQAIADDYLSLPDAVEELPAAALMLSGASASTDLRMVYDKTGQVSLVGTLSVSTVTAGTSVLTIPRYLMPAQTTNMTALAYGAGGALSPCYVYLDTSTGTLRLAGVSAGTTAIIFSGSTWRSAAV